MAYFKVLSGHLPTDLEETTRTISWGGQFAIQ
jgi:hypothetical protein